VNESTHLAIVVAVTGANVTAARLRRRLRRPLERGELGFDALGRALEPIEQWAVESIE
jgi:hypothetical protein